MIDRVNAGTVALIAEGIMRRKWDDGHIDSQDFTSMKPYGSAYKTMRERKHHEACIEAWDLVIMAESLRPMKEEKPSTS